MKVTGTNLYQPINPVDTSRPPKDTGTGSSNHICYTVLIKNEEIN